MTPSVPPIVATDQPLRLVGCGILHKEVDFLVAKNNWNIETEFLDSALHNYLNRLSSELDGVLDRDEQAGRDTVVFYGACHPQMDNILQHHHTLRTHGQNCIVMLLGHERFMTELAKGAYFLLEDWALTWKPMLTDAFGDNQEILREIFRGSHQCMIAIRTPCSSDFKAAAEAAAAYVDLPLQWLDVDLDHLESILADAIMRKGHKTGAERP